MLRIHTIGYCLIIKMNELLMPRTTWMSLQNIKLQNNMLQNIKQPDSKDHMLYDSISTQYPEKATPQVQCVKQSRAGSGSEIHGNQAPEKTLVERSKTGSYDGCTPRYVY